MEAKFPLLIEGILFGMKRYPSAFQKHYIIIFIKKHIFSARFGLRLVQRVIREMNNNPSDSSILGTM
jgi:hypothetical protein